MKKNEGMPETLKLTKLLQIRFTFKVHRKKIVGCSIEHFVDERGSPYMTPGVKDFVTSLYKAYY